MRVQSILIHAENVNLFFVFAEAQKNQIRKKKTLKERQNKFQKKTEKKKEKE